MTVENVTFITKSNLEGLEVDYAIIDRGNGEFTSMLKSTYDEQQAEHLNGIVDVKAATE